MNRWKTSTLATTCALAWLTSMGAAQTTSTGSTSARDASPPRDPQIQVESNTNQSRTVDQDHDALRVTAPRSNNTSSTTTSLERLSGLVGESVDDANGNKLGEIDNLAIDTQQGEVAFAILSVDGRMIPVPWRSLEVRRSGDRDATIILDTDRETLRQAPTIKGREWREMSDENFTRKVRQHFGASTSSGADNISYVPAPSNSPRQPLMRDRFETKASDRPDTVEYRRDIDRQDNDRRNIRHEKVDFDQNDPRVTKPSEAGPGGYGGQATPGSSDGQNNFVDRHESDVAYLNERESNRSAELESNDHVTVRHQDTMENNRKNDDVRKTSAKKSRKTAKRSGDHCDDKLVTHQSRTGPGGYAGGVWGSPDPRLVSDERQVTSQVNTNRDTSNRMIADREMTRSNKTVAQATSGSTIVMASDLLDADAQTIDHSKLGEVEDILVTNDGRIAFMVVGTGGVLGVGERLHAVPFTLTDLRDTNQSNLVLVDVETDRFNQAPSFGRGDWQDITSDSNRMQETYTFYGVSDDGSAYGYIAPTQPQRLDQNRSPNMDSLQRDSRDTPDSNRDPKQQEPENRRNDGVSEDFPERPR